jgi:hypothetical protein
MTNLPDSPTAAAVPRDGCYQGGNGDLFVEIRLDADGAKVVSADVYATSATGRHYIASVRSAPGREFVPDGEPEVAIWQDSLGATTTGTIAVGGGPARPDHLLATFSLDQRLNGLPPHADLVVVAERVGAEFRRLGVELESEEEVRLPAAVTFGGQSLTFRECLGRAGFAVHDAGMATRIPVPANGRWDLSSTFTILDDLMAQTAQASLLLPAWELHLLMLGKSSRDGLLGVMFDAGGVLPRQGAAVFVTEIRDRVADADEDRKIIQTSVHELGHALNLAHRFERVVGRADSTSFMNYDWRFLGGDQRDEYWRRFAFTFDADELEFLHHAPRSALVPGGADFHTVNYWADGTGGYSPYVPEEPVPGFVLRLNPPASGTVFAFGQPVFLEVALQNQTGQGINLPAEVLDPKAGFLEVLVQRRTGGTSRGLVDARPFIPIMQRCFDLDPRTADTLQHGQTLRSNLNLTFGSGGFAFAEPGEYDLTPLLSFMMRDAIGNPIDWVIRGETIRIRVAHPHDMGEERDATTLFRADVGAWFALGGSDSLAGAGEALEEVKARRIAAFGEADPVVAAITRAAGLHAMRPSTRFDGEQFSQAGGDPATAARLLGSLDQAALATFDNQTAASTQRLAARLAAG